MNTQDNIASLDSQLLDELDALLLKAVSGDRRAIGAIAFGYGMTLLKEARDALSQARASEAEEVLQDLFVGMTQGIFEFVPGRDHAHEWLRERLEILATATSTDLIIARAADRDPDAVAQVFELLSGALLEEARAVLRECIAHDPEDVVQDLAEELLEGVVSFDRGRRGGIQFLRRRVREMARERRREAEGTLFLHFEEEGWE